MNDYELNWETMKGFLRDRIDTCRWTDHKEIYEKLLDRMMQYENAK